MDYTKDKFYWCYYAFLLLVLLSWNDNLQPPPMIYRLAFLFAVITPTFWKRDWTVPVMLLFIISGTQGFSYSYMPYDTYIYVFVMGLLAMVHGLFRRYSHQIPRVLIGLFLYVTMINFLTNMEWHKMSESLLLIMIFCLFIDAGNEKQIDMVSIAFAICSLVLSYQFFKYFSVTAVLNVSGFEQGGWTDRNYFGTIVGMGVLVSIIQLLTKERLDTIRRVLYVTSIVVATIALGMIASRGSMVSLGGSVLVLLMFAKLSAGKKTLFFISIVAMVFVIFNYDVFDYLIYRIENDDGTGSGRIIIWQNKLAAYNGVGVLDKLFGLGHLGGLRLGYNGIETGFHNEFLAMLMEYGVIGFCFLIGMLFGLFRKFWKQHKVMQAPVVESLSLYLIFTAFTLEPLTTGFCSFFLFYYYIIMWRNYLIRNNQ